MKKNAISDLLFLAFVWTFAVIIVNPQGNFPLIDDWSYGITVKRLYEEGRYYPVGFASHSLIAHVIWGALFCVFCDFSFETLRFSTIIISLLGIQSIYLIVRQINPKRYLALIIALLVAFNPIYFALSFTFMTDVPFITFTCMSIFFLIRSLKFELSLDFIIGSILSTIAILCRQNGFFIPIAYAIAYFRKFGWKRHHFFRMTFPMIFGASALFVFESWMKKNEIIPAIYGLQIKQLWNLIRTSQELHWLIAKNSFIALSYLGLFLFPVLLISRNSKIKNFIWLKLASIFFGVLFLIVFIYKKKTMPLMGNIFHFAGVGPSYLYKSSLPELPKKLWLTVTALSCIGGGLILTKALHNLFYCLRNRATGDFFIFGAVIYFCPLAILGGYDRYLMPFIILSFFILASSNWINNFSQKKSVRFITFFYIISLMLFSIISTHDYLSLNRTRWKALQNLLLNDNIHPSLIDGGFEFNGLFLYNSNYKKKENKNWYWVVDDVYAVSYREIAGYDALYSYEYIRWMPPQNKNKIFVLKRRNL